MQFKNLKDMQKYFEDVTPMILYTDHVKNVLAKEMQTSVKQVVYNYYKPTKYPRRKDNGGLSDPRNMEFTMAKTINGKVYMRFENLTVSQTHYLPIYEIPIDSLHEEVYITDTIEEGGSWDKWYHLGKWSRPRPFVKDAIFHLKADAALVNGIKKAFRDDGYKVK